MSESDLAIMAALVFAWGTLSARLERFDVTARRLIRRAPGAASGTGTDPPRQDS